MDKRKILIIGGGGCGLEQAVIALLKQMEQQIIIVDRPSNVSIIKARQNIHDNLLDIQKLGFNQTNFTPEREYDWYHCFNKRNNKRNLKVK
jgi:thioredoxin reductase